MKAEAERGHEKVGGSLTEEWPYICRRTHSNGGIKVEAMDKKGQVMLAARSFLHSKHFAKTGFAPKIRVHSWTDIRCHDHDRPIRLADVNVDPISSLLLYRFHLSCDADISLGIMLGQSNRVEGTARTAFFLDAKGNQP